MELFIEPGLITESQSQYLWKLAKLLGMSKEDYRKYFFEYTGIKYLGHVESSQASNMIIDLQRKLIETNLAPINIVEEI